MMVAFLGLGLLIDDVYSKDIVLEETLSKLSQDTYYQLIEKKIGGKIIKNGKMGNFSNCLKRYKSNFYKKSKEGKSIRRDIWISNKVSFTITIVKNEAFVFSIRRLNDRGKRLESSNSYAINCSINLLGSSKETPKTESYRDLYESSK